MDKVLFSSLPISTIILVIVLFSLDYNLPSIQIYQQACAHFFGVPVLKNKTAGDYKIVFKPYPTIPIAGDNSTKIKLIILGKDDQNINAVFASLIIKAKDTGGILEIYLWILRIQ
jgi:hypothetical protein